MRHFKIFRVSAAAVRFSLSRNGVEITKVQCKREGGRGPQGAGPYIGFMAGLAAYHGLSQFKRDLLGGSGRDRDLLLVGLISSQQQQYSKQEFPVAIARSISEGDLRWEKQVGDAVEEGEIICELKTDKTSVPVPSPMAGVIRKQLVDDGSAVNSGMKLAEIEWQPPLANNNSGVGGLPNNVNGASPLSPNPEQDNNNSKTTAANNSKPPTPTVSILQQPEQVQQQHHDHPPPKRVQDNSNSPVPTVSILQQQPKQQPSLSMRQQQGKDQAEKEVPVAPVSSEEAAAPKSYADLVKKSSAPTAAVTPTADFGGTNVVNAPHHHRKPALKQQQQNEVSNNHQQQ